MVISDIFTVSDEALCILLLENNAADYAMMLKEKRIINRKEARPKYTKVLFSDKDSRVGIEEVYEGSTLLWTQLKKLEN